MLNKHLFLAPQHMPTHPPMPTHSPKLTSFPPGQRITRSLRSLVFASVMKQEIGFFDTNKTGELINRLSADTSLVSQSVTMNISDGLRSVVMAMAGVGMMVRVTLLLLFRVSSSVSIMSWYLEINCSNWNYWTNAICYYYEIIPSLIQLIDLMLHLKLLLWV